VPSPAARPARSLPSGVPDGLVFAGVVVLLGLATWLFHGYTYGLWPQPGFLVNVVHFDGELEGDWFTTLPAVHWAFANGLGLLPFSWVEPAVLIGWLVYLGVLWSAFLLLARSVGLSWLAALAAGLLVASTDLDGLGLSGVVEPYLYPTGLAFALGLLSIALIVRDRVLLAGVALGLAALVHPGSGALLIVVIVPVVLLWRERRWVAAAWFVVPALVIASPSLYHVVADQASGSALSPQQQYDLLAEVRLPHHLLYSVYPLSEYLRTLAWLALAGVGGWALRRERAVAIMSSVGLLAVALCAVGAIASLAGGPLTLVQIQTSRITPLLIVFGVLFSAALLARLAGRWTAALLLAVVAAGIVAFDRVVPEALQRLSLGDALVDVSLGLVYAVGVAIVLLGAWAVARWRRGRGDGLARYAPALVAVAAVAVVLAVVEFRHQRTFGPSAQEQALADVSDHARELTRPGQLILSPPDVDGVSFLTRRPAVVSFGTYAFGADDAEWVRRMIDVTGNPEVVDPAFGRDAFARGALIARSYDERVATSAQPICRYDAKLVITRATAPLPRWLHPVYRNDDYVLSRPVEACR
jgi:hypothetical protein